MDHRGAVARFRVEVFCTLNLWLLGKLPSACVGGRVGSSFKKENIEERSKKSITKTTKPVRKIEGNPAGDGSRVRLDKSEDKRRNKN